MSKKSNLKRFEDMLSNHNWLYFMDEDDGVYYEGAEHSKSINGYFVSLCKSGYEKEALSLYEKYSPFSRDLKKDH